MKKPAKIERLVNWYNGTFCYKCRRVDDEDMGMKCFNNLKKVENTLTESGIMEMTHKEFRMLIKENSTFCRPIKRVFCECEICKKLGIKF